MRAQKPKRSHSPRRKAGRAVRKTERKIRFRLVVEAQEMIVEYKPNWSEGEFAVGHFEFRSPFDPPRPTVVSETGYLSHFAPMEEIAAYDSPEAYARTFVLAVLNRGRKRQSSETGGEQLSLF